MRSTPRLKLTAVEVELESGRLRRLGSGEEESLSPRELELLRYLAERPGELVPRERLLVELWGYSERVRSRTVDTTLARLRARVERDPSRPDHLLTQRGGGYCFRPTPPILPPAPGPVGLHGRQVELAELRRLCATHRLVTLLGPGGVGKTRLARELGQLLPAAWVDLSPLSDAQGLNEAIARALGPRSPEGWEGLVELLVVQGRRLLILDNAEHLAIGLASEVEQLLLRAPQLSLLLTSRQALELPAERILRLEPLPLEAASALFLERCAAQGSPLDPGEPGLRELLEGLDGLPLAIELAASRAELYTLTELGERLHRDRFRLLQQPGPGRHRSLSSTLASSWAALGAGERRCLGLLAALPGPCTTAALAAALGEEGEAADAMLLSLRRRSLLHLERSPASLRHRLLYSLRDWVRAEPEGKPPPGCLERLEAWLCAEGQRLLDRVGRPGEGGAAMAWLSEELHHLEFLLERRPGPTLRRLLVSIYRLRGPMQRALLLLQAPEAQEEDEALRWLELANLRRQTGDLHGGLEAAREACQRLQGHPQLWQAELAWGSGLDQCGRSEEARRFLLERLAAHPRGGVAHLRLLRAAAECGCLSAAERGAEMQQIMELTEDGRWPHHRYFAARELASLAWRRGEREEARRLFGEASALARGNGHPLDLARALLGQAAAELEGGDPERTAALLDECEPLWAAVGHPLGVAAVHSNRASLMLQRGEPALALPLYQRCADIFRLRRDQRQLWLTLGNLAVAALDAGDRARAAAVVEEALGGGEPPLLRESGILWGVSGMVALEEGQSELAEQRFQRAAALLQEAGDLRMGAWIGGWSAINLALQGLPWEQRLTEAQAAAGQVGDAEVCRGLWLQRAALLLRRGREVEARAACDHGLALPSASVALELLGQRVERALRGLGPPEGADPRFYDLRVLERILSSDSPRLTP